MTETIQMEELVEEFKETCDCKTAITEKGQKSSDDVRIVRFIGVTDEESNKHRFPREILQQMVSESKHRFVLPFHPNSISEIDPAQIPQFEALAKEQGMAKDPIPIRDMHHTKFQGTKMGRVLSIETKFAPFVDKETKQLRQKMYHDVVAEIFDEKAIKLLDRGMLSKFSIGFKHKYDLVNGVKVSTYSVIDHYGGVDVPADPDALLVEAKEKDGMTLPDCIHAKILAGMSQEEAGQACKKEMKTMGFEQARKSVFGQQGEPSADSGDEGYRDCVSSLVAQGTDREDAEAACRGKSTSSDRSEVSPTTPTEQPSTSPNMIDGKALLGLLEDEDVSYETKEAILDLEDAAKAQSELISELFYAQKERDAVIADLLEERKESEVMSEVGVLVQGGYISPGSAETAFKHAMSLPSVEHRAAFYDTFEGRQMDFGEKSFGGSPEYNEEMEQSEKAAAIEMFGEDGAKMGGWN